MILLGRLRRLFKALQNLPGRSLGQLTAAGRLQSRSAAAKSGVVGDGIQSGVSQGKDFGEAALECLFVHGIAAALEGGYHHIAHLIFFK